MSMNRKTYIIRWLLIILIFMSYILLVVMEIMSYGVAKKYTEILKQKTITIEACNAVVYDFEQHFNNLVTISFFGYIISMILILLVFRRVR